MDGTTERPDEGGWTAATSEVLGGGRSLDRSLERWAADAAVDEAARRRARARWLQVAAEEEASLVGTLVDLGERGQPVVVEVGDHRMRGTIAGVGGDFVAVRTERGGPALVPLDVVDAVRAEPGAADVRGDRAATLDVTLDAVLGPIAADRPDVLVRTRGGVVLRGQLRSAGSDVLRLRVEGDPPTPTWVPVSAVAVIVLDVS